MGLFVKHYFKIALFAPSFPNEEGEMAGFFYSYEGCSEPESL